jgi:iron(III) transport system permease protein
MSGIGWVYLFAAIGLTLIAVSIGGNILSSFQDPENFDAYTLGNYAELFTDEQFFEVSGRTILLGIGTVAWLFVFALPFTWLITRTDFPWKTGLFTLLTAKLAIPGFISAMAYVWLFNPSSGLVNQIFGMTNHVGDPLFDVYQLSWICFLQGIILVPGGVFMMIPAFRNMDASLEEAAWVSGLSKPETIRKIVLPLLAPSMFAVAIFYFVIGVELFDFVAIIGMPGDVLVLWIYDALNVDEGQPNLGYAGAAGVMLFTICGGAILFYVRFLRQAAKYAVVGGKSRATPPRPMGRWRWLASTWVGVWVFFAVGLPVLALIWVSLVPYIQPPSAKAISSINLSAFTDAMDWIGGPLKNTLIVMTGAVVIGVTLAITITWVVTRGPSKAGRWADAFVFLAPAVPSIVAATAFQYLSIEIYIWLPLYGTIWLLAIAMATRMLAYCTRTMNTTSLQIQRELDEAAYVSGVSPLATFWKIFLPLMMPAIFYAALMVGMLAARDLTLPLIMSRPETEVVSVLIFNLQTNGDQNAAAAVALYMIVVLVLLALFARRFTGMQEMGVHQRRARPRFSLKIPGFGVRRTTEGPAE